MKTSLLAIAATIAGALAKGPNVADFDWSSVKPSSSLNYTTCYHDHKCARLTVPLDWLNETNPARVTLAIIARPAQVSQDDPAFGGTVITNPGGPGGSGVEFLLNRGKTLQDSTDRGNKKYEILSFDPRGMGLTEPRSDCVRDALARTTFSLEEQAIGQLDGNLANIILQRGRNQAFGQLCQDADSKWEEIRGYMSTSSVARDMVEIVDKLHELRYDGQVADQVDQGGAEAEKRLELRSDSQPDKTPRILYWGFSYGTVLGRYFVSMFPGRVGRVILEGVVDIKDYAAAVWATNLPDTQQCLQHFWDTCHDAGDKCALHKSSDKGPDDLKDRVRGFIDGLDENPAFHINGSDFAVIRKQQVMGAIFMSLYKPQAGFPQMAEAIAEAMEGNYTSLYGQLDRPRRDRSCPLSAPDQYSYTWEIDAQTSVLCGDGDSQTWMQPQDMADHVANVTALSPDFGEFFATIRLRCAGWQGRPRYNFKGPFTTPKVDTSLSEGKPAAGILFASARYDPVTPLRHARGALPDHPGSQVLLQENVGHGSLLSPGKCREEFLAGYLDTGKLPDEEVVCQPDCVPFQKCEGMDAAAADAYESGPRYLPLHI